MNSALFEGWKNAGSTSEWLRGEQGQRSDNDRCTNGQWTLMIGCWAVYGEIVNWTMTEPIGLNNEFQSSEQEIFFVFEL